LESFEKSKEKLVPQTEMCKQSLLRKHKAPRWEANPQPLAWQTWDISVMLPGRRRLSDTLTALFKPRHARQYGGISFELRRSMGGSVATSIKICKTQLVQIPTNT